MKERQKISSNSPYEPVFGYSRAVRVGDTVHVSGTVAWGPDGKLLGKGDAYAQAKQALANIEHALAGAGATLAHVVRTRIYVTDATYLDAAGRAHGEVFGEIRPAATAVVVSGLADAEMLVEIEAEAVV